MENWRRFVEGQRPHYRLIGNIITELTEEQLKEFPLSDKELDEIKKWGDLEGKPSILGTGSMGAAYLFKNKKEHNGYALKEYTFGKNKFYRMTITESKAD